MGSIQSYTKAALDALLGGKSDVGHTHAGGSAPVVPYAIAEVSSDFNTFSGFSDSMDYQALRYLAPENPFPYSLPSQDISWLTISSTEPWKLLVPPGVYSATLEFGLAWPAGQSANAPTAFRPIIAFGGEGGDFNFEWYPATTGNDGLVGLRRVLHSKMIASDGQFTNFSVQCSHTNAGAYPTGSGAVRRAFWQITKWY